MIISKNLSEKIKNFTFPMHKVLVTVGADCENTRNLGAFCSLPSSLRASQLLFCLNE